MEKQNPAIVGLGDELSPQDLSRLHPTPDGYKHEMEDNHHHSTLVTVPPMSRRSHDIQKWGIGDFHAVKVTKSMLNKDMRSRLLQGTKTVYAEWLEQGLIGADQIFDLKEATDQVSSALNISRFLREKLTVPLLQRPSTIWRIHCQIGVA